MKSSIAEDIFSIECPILALNLVSSAADLVDSYIGILDAPEYKQNKFKHYLGVNSIFECPEKISLGVLLKHLLYIIPWCKLNFR